MTCCVSDAALHHAAANCIVMAVRLLLDVRADTTIVNKEGLTAVEIARARLGSTSLARRLLVEDEQLQHLSRWTSIPVRSVTHYTISYELTCGV